MTRYTLGGFARRRAGRVAVAASLVGVFSGALAVGAQAADFDSIYRTANTYWGCVDGEPGDYFCRTDNGLLTFVIEPGMTDKGDADVRAVLANEYGPTDLQRSEHTGSEVEYSGSTETDIVYDYEPGDLGPGVLGVTWCNDSTGGDECDQHYVLFEHSDPWQSTICHETGHAVGLTHGREASPRQDNGLSALGCMRAESFTSDMRDLGSHNVGQINGTYAAP